MGTLSPGSFTIALPIKLQRFQVGCQQAWACRNELSLLLACRWLVCPLLTILTMLTKLLGL
jgi:hypothetical protein